MKDYQITGIELYSECACSPLLEFVSVVPCKVRDIYTIAGKVRPRLIIRKSNAKGKLATRSIPVIEDLRKLLTDYYPLAGDDYLFPRRSNGHISENSAARILRQACQRVGIEGVSTHSFRRTALTQMSNAGIPLRVIQELYLDTCCFNRPFDDQTQSRIYLEAQAVMTILSQCQSLNWKLINSSALIAISVPVKGIIPKNVING